VLRVKFDDTSKEQFSCVLSYILKGAVSTFHTEKTERGITKQNIRFCGVGDTSTCEEYSKA
jgi:hypothetical protein